MGSFSFNSSLPVYRSPPFPTSHLCGRETPGPPWQGLKGDPPDRLSAEPPSP